MAGTGTPGGYGRPPATKPPRWQQWLLSSVMIVAAPFGILFSTGFFGEDAASAPEDLCSVIPGKTLSSLVPTPKVTRSEADNDGPYSRYGYCEVETDEERATSNAEGSLSVELQRHGTVGSDGPEREASSSFVGSKEYALKEGDGEVLDVPRLGDSAYATVESDDFDKTRRSVQLRVLVGSDTLRISYYLSPTSDKLALAGAVAGARSIIKGLSS